MFSQQLCTANAYGLMRGIESRKVEDAFTGNNTAGQANVIFEPLPLCTDLTSTLSRRIWVDMRFQPSLMTTFWWESIICVKVWNLTLGKLRHQDPELDWWRYLDDLIDDPSARILASFSVNPCPNSSHTGLDGKVYFSSSFPYLVWESLRRLSTLDCRCQ